MTGSLINVVLIFLAYLLIGKVEDIARGIRTVRPTDRQE